MGPAMERDVKSKSHLVTKTTLATKVADSLVAFILEEGLGEGDILPATAALADRYGVSRTGGARPSPTSPGAASCSAARAVAVASPRQC